MIGVALPIRNPRVDRYLADKAFDHIDHALGRHFDPTDETFRNYFATEAGGDLSQAFDASPYWEKGGQRGDMAYYHVTREGAYALKAYLAEHAPIGLFEIEFNGFSSSVPAKTAASAKYKDWLNRSGGYPDLKFITFARHARIRRVA